jgi:large subunit ribosomal protein L4
MIEAPHFSAAGAKKKAVALPEALFDGTVNTAAMHQAVVTYLANQRQGTADTKTRAEVSGGNQKPWRQKGTGRARQGSTRAPHWRHGGVVFGPHPRDYRLAIPRKVRQLARKSALNARAREGALLVIDPIALEKPKTKPVAELLDKLGVAGKKVLLLTSGDERARPTHLAGRNIRNVRVLRFADATAYELLWSEVVVVELPALGEATAVKEKEKDDA